MEVISCPSRTKETLKSLSESAAGGNTDYENCCESKRRAGAINRSRLTVTNLGEARKLNIKAMRRRAVARIRRNSLESVEFDVKVSLFETSISQSCLPYWLVTTVGVLRTRRYGLRALFYRSFQRIDLFRKSLFRRVPIGRRIFFVTRSASWHITILTLRIRGTCK